MDDQFFGCNHFRGQFVALTTCHAMATDTQELDLATRRRFSLGRASVDSRRLTCRSPLSPPSSLPRSLVQVQLPIPSTYNVLTWAVTCAAVSMSSQSEFSKSVGVARGRKLLDIIKGSAAASRGATDEGIGCLEIMSCCCHFVGVVGGSRLSTLFAFKCSGMKLKRSRRHLAHKRYRLGVCLHSELAEPLNKYQGATRCEGSKSC